MKEKESKPLSKGKPHPADKPVSLYPFDWKEALKLALNDRQLPKNIGEIKLKDIGKDKPPAKFLGEKKPPHNQGDKK